MKIALKETSKQILSRALSDLDATEGSFDTGDFDIGVHKDEGVYVAWDNRAGDCYVEEFPTPQGAINWAYGQMIFSTKRHCTEGFCINDGEWYCDAKNEDKLEMLIELWGFENKEEAYEAGFYYFTEWDDEEFAESREKFKGDLRQLVEKSDVDGIHKEALYDFIIEYEGELKTLLNY